MQITNFNQNYNQQITFNATVKNTRVLRNILEHADNYELSRFNSVLDAMKERLDEKVFDFTEVLINNSHKLCLDSVIRNSNNSPMMSWHSSDLAEGKSFQELYKAALEKANNKLLRSYPAEIKENSREISLAEIYSKLV